MESRMTVGIFGAEEWYNENGELHRTDGPAVIWPDGPEIWYKNGQLHRENGPAVIWTDGDITWCLNGNEFSFTEWVNELNLDQKTRVEMVLKWNPD